MIKVLNITEEGRGGGAMYRIITVAKSINKEVQTVVLCPVSAKGYHKKLENAEIAYLTTPMISISISFPRLFKYVVRFIPEIISICQIIKELNPSVVHANGSWQIKGILASFLMKRPCIWHLNDTYQHRLILLLFSLLSKIPAYYIFASEATRNYYAKRIKKKNLNTCSTVVQATIDIPSFQKKVKYICGKKKWKALMIGYINENKGIELLLEAAPLIGYDLEIDIVGPVIATQKKYWDSLQQIQEKCLATNVSFLGYRDVNENLFKEYDFYICSSRREASPIAVWQALSFGLPVVSTNVGDVKLVVEKYSCGFVIKEFEVPSLIGAIEKLINSPALQLKSMSDGALLASKELFDINVVRKQYIEIYKLF